MDQREHSSADIRCLLLCLLSFLACVTRLCLLWIESPSYIEFLIVLVIYIPLYYVRKWSNWDLDDPRMNNFKQFTIRYGYILFLILVVTRQAEHRASFGLPFNALILFYIGIIIYVGLHFYGSYILSPKIQKHDQ